MSDMSRYDAERLHQLIANHARYTNSERAKDILAAWNDYLPKFRKVMPVEYRRALAEMKAIEITDPAARGGGGVSRVSASRSFRCVSHWWPQPRCRRTRLRRAARAHQSASRCRAGAQARFRRTRGVDLSGNKHGREVVQINVAEDFGAGLPPVIYVVNPGCCVCVGIGGERGQEVTSIVRHGDDGLYHLDY